MGRILANVLSYNFFFFSKNERVLYWMRPWVADSWASKLGVTLGRCIRPCVLNTAYLNRKHSCSQLCSLLVIDLLKAGSADRPLSPAGKLWGTSQACFLLHQSTLYYNTPPPKTEEAFVLDVQTTPRECDGVRKQLDIHISVRYVIP